MALLPQNPRDQKMVAAAVVAFALAALYWNFVWTPKHTQLAELTVRLDTLDARNASARARIAQGTAADLEAEAARYTKDLEVPSSHSRGPRECPEREPYLRLIAESARC